MKSLFSVHAGEYLVGSYIEQHLSKFDIWLPSKDTGIDLLLTSPRKHKRTSLQVKFSKDFLSTNMSPQFRQDLLSCGWWTLKRDKIRSSKADFWVFVLYSFGERQTQYVIIRPKELLRILKAVHGSSPTYNVYLWVTMRQKCWEARGLNSADQQLLARNVYRHPKRDLSKYLNDWASIARQLR